MIINNNNNNNNKTTSIISRRLEAGGEGAVLAVGDLQQGEDPLQVGLRGDNR